MMKSIKCAVRWAVVVSAAVMFMLPLNASAEPAEGKMIAKCSVSCEADECGLNITAKTQSIGIMDEIGCVEIKVQRSSDGGNWVDETFLTGLTETDRRYSIYRSDTLKIEGGGFYRAVCTHYALGKRFSDGSEAYQRICNVSRAVWVDNVPAPPAPETSDAGEKRKNSAVTAVSSESAAAASSATTSAVSAPAVSSSAAPVSSAAGGTSSPAAEKNGGSPYTSDSGAPVVMLAVFTASAVFLRKRR